MDREKQAWVEEARRAFGIDPSVDPYYAMAMAANKRAMFWNKVSLFFALVSLAAFGYRLFFMQSCS